MIIQHNMPAANTNRQLGITTNSLSKSTEKLSSGYRVNRAADDAAGLAISEKMRSQIRGLDQGSRNAQDGISLIQTAEGALNETHSMLQRMRELVVQAANDTYTSSDRAKVDLELAQLSEEITRISTDTEFNEMTLLDGTFTDKQFHVGANQEQVINVAIEQNMSADELGVADIAVGVSNGSEVEDFFEAIDNAIELVSNTRATLGGYQNRLEHTVANVDNTSENLQAAESRIRDVNMADEMVNYSKDTILQQAAQSMLAQANQQTQGVLALLQ